MVFLRPGPALLPGFIDQLTWQARRTLHMFLYGRVKILENKNPTSPLGVEWFKVFHL